MPSCYCGGNRCGDDDDGDGDDDGDDDDDDGDDDGDDDDGDGATLPAAKGAAKLAEEAASEGATKLAEEAGGEGLVVQDLICMRLTRGSRAAS